VLPPVPATVVPPAPPGPASREPVLPPLPLRPPEPSPVPPPDAVVPPDPVTPPSPLRPPDAVVPPDPVAPPSPLLPPLPVVPPVPGCPPEPAGSLVVLAPPLPPAGGVLEGETHAATDSHTKTERSADRETDVERCMISPVRGRRRLGDAVASKQWQRPAVSVLAALRCAARPAAGYWALTLTCEPSYLTTWSGVAVTSRPLP
jgi:hypothetical protein